MNQGFFKKNKILSINLLYIASIIPAIVFGFYKNGIFVSSKDYMSFFLATQYIVIPVIIILLSYAFESYYYLGIKKEENTNSVVNSIAPYVNALCYLVCAPSNSLLVTVPLICALDVAIKFVDEKLKVNQVALFKCILFGVLTLLSMSTSNANIYEASVGGVITDPSSLFVGNGIGEIGVTSSLCALVGYVVLVFNTYYKKDIPLVCLLSYACVGIIMYFIGGLTFNQLLVNTFTSGFIFVSVFVASLSTATPVVRGGRIVYSILVGILSAVMINILEFNIGVYIVILVASLLTPLFNKLKLSFDK